MKKLLKPLLIIILIPVLVFASVCICRINWKVNTYEYNPELDQPGIGVDMRYDDLIGKLYLRWSDFLNDLQCDLWKAPEGVHCRKLVLTTRDGSSIGGYILEPEGAEEEVLPSILYCHGGAFYLTMMPFQLDLSSLYAKELHCRVFIPQYRISLDRPYPGALNDCFDTLQYAIEKGKADKDHITILGDSAGGCLATELTRMCLNEGLVTPEAQVLIYPVSDNSMDYESMEKYQYAPWPKEANRTMWKLYLNGYTPVKDDYAVPMLREDFEGFPPTYLEAAEADILYDQDLAYGEKMLKADVDVTLVKIPGAYHGYDGNIKNEFVEKMLKQRLAWMKDIMAFSE